MLTRLSVDGFKNLVGLQLELGPFTCVTGPNGSGKSNLFDALRFLSLTADHSFADAARRLRGSEGRTGDWQELFWTDGSERADRMAFAAELIVPPRVLDEVGRPAEPSITLLRYELVLRNLDGALVLDHESLSHIRVGDAHKHLRFPHSAKDFRRVVVRGRRSAPLISTTDGLVQVHLDHGTSKAVPPAPAHAAQRSLLSCVTTAADPTILAARRELQSWRRLALDPGSLRTPDRLEAPSDLGSDGSHLPATLGRLEAHDPELARLSERLSKLVGTARVQLDRDPRRGTLTLEVAAGNGPPLSARSVSDGTLRAAALCALLADPDAGGLWCMEEPDAAIHPARMGAVVDLLRDMAVDPTAAPGPDNPVRQVLVNTHSPAFVGRVPDADLLLAETRDGRLRLRPLQDSWRCRTGEPGVVKDDVLAWLEVAPGGQVSLTRRLGR